MSMNQRGNPSTLGKPRSLLLLILLLGGALLAFFHRSLVPHQVLFANDGPLGSMSAHAEKMSQAITGFWHDLYWVGGEQPIPAPDFSDALSLALPPVIYLKIYAPLCLFLAGFSVWLFFRELEFGPMVCVLGGLAGGLNMLFFSNACWGLSNWNLTVATMFLSLSALVTKRIRQSWAKALLCGLGVGFGLMEGFDIGAILSLYTGVSIFFIVWNDEGSLTRKVTRSVWMPIVVVLFSAFVAYQTISTLVQTQIQGVAGTGQKAEEKQAHWDFATQWSLPLEETCRILVPGAFGYRMSAFLPPADKASAYWGSIGEDARIPLLESQDAKVRIQAARSIVQGGQLPPELEKALEGGDPNKLAEAVNLLRGRLSGAWSGSGEYPGVVVLILAAFGLANTLRQKDGPFLPAERRAVWYWAVIAVVSLLLALGR